MSRDCGCPDLDATLYVTTDELGKADAFITSAERLIERYGVGVEDTDEDTGHGDDHDPGRLRNNLAHLVESAKIAVRAAQYTHDRTVTAFQKHRAETETAPVTAEHEVQP